jgi:transcription termination factor Rho
MTDSTTEPSQEAPLTASKRPAKRKTKDLSAALSPAVSDIVNASMGLPAAVTVEKPARKARTKTPVEDSARPPSKKRTLKETVAAASVAAIPTVQETSNPLEKTRTPKARKQAPKKTLQEESLHAHATEAWRVEEPSPKSQDENFKNPSAAPASKRTPAVRTRRKKADAASEMERSEPVPEHRHAPVHADAASSPERKPRGTRKKASAVPPALNAPSLPQSSDALETWSPGQRAVSPSTPPNTPADTLRKPYPVYVPLHVAKQMEQEGKPAPLAVAPDAHQAAEIRAASYENRHGGAPAAVPATDYSHGRDHSRDASRERARGEGGRNLRPERNAERAPQERHERSADRGQDRGQHGRHADRHDRKRSKHDRRREGRDEHHNRHQEGHHAHDSSRELPPPTPEELSEGEGIIEISGKGFGFLRDRTRNYVQSPADIFVSPEMVRRFNLRDGQLIKGTVRKSGRGQQMHEIQSVNGDAPESSKLQPVFDELTVINPSEPLWMATTPEKYTTRIIDMVAPIGKGQRGLIVAPPRTGKTTFLQHIAEAMMKNHPEVQLIMLLVDERPEEVTEIRHTVPKAEIMASSNDMDVRSHTRIAELAIERAKRLVEAGKDVFILLDSITRLGRAFNNALTNGGRTMSGGIDARAMETPRKLFAAARNTEEAGSLTIIATALIETGSRMDEIIFQEFKGTGNMELVLDRKIAEQRIYPAVDIFQSGTRREELLVPADTLHKIHFLRRGLAGCRPSDAIDRLLFYLKKFQTNEQMLREIRG